MDYENWLWFCSIPGLYRRDQKLLLDYFKNPENIRKALSKEFRLIPNLREEVRNAVTEFQKKSCQEAAELLRKKRVTFISCEDESYPCQLREIRDYPYGLFVKGKLPERNQRCIGIVGARTCTEYGRKTAELIAQTLAGKQIAVISGMARGIDGAAQRKCLAAGMESYAVAGCGLDICYPKEHIELFADLEKKGGIISEYPPSVLPHPSYFPQRNRIISGLCDTVIVVEARKKSGSLITADQALEQGRDVYAVPGRMGDVCSEGCNHLIAQGAGIITGMEQLLEELGVESQVKRKNTDRETAAENMVHLFLGEKGRSVEELAGDVKYQMTEVKEALLRLEKKKMAYRDMDGWHRSKEEKTV